MQKYSFCIFELRKIMTINPHTDLYRIKTTIMFKHNCLNIRNIIYTSLEVKDDLEHDNDITCNLHPKKTSKDSKESH
jgi:hypothetical protein